MIDLTYRIMFMPITIMLLIFMWGLQGLQFIVDLTNFGILPRTFEGFIQIPLAPWIHGDLSHIVSNSIPFLILGLLVEFKSKDAFIKVVLLGAILGGLVTWMFGSTAFHIGVSGLVLTFWAFLIADGYYSKKLRDIGIAIVVLILYGSFAYEIVNVQAHISWIGHVGGMIVGGFIAAWHNKKLNIMKE